MDRDDGAASRRTGDLNVAAVAVAAIAIVGAVSSYLEKYLTTSVSQWVAHDLRRTLYHHIQLKSVRDQISFVLQDTLLFRATIWENIAYGKPNASPSEIRHAAELADAHGFIMEMPDGYDTIANPDSRGSQDHRR